MRIIHPGPVPLQPAEIGDLLLELLMITGEVCAIAQANAGTNEDRRALEGYRKHLLEREAKLRDRLIGPGGGTA